jgi:hypothetical protein
MPLILNTVETERQKEFCWDPENESESCEVHTEIKDLVAKGYDLKLYLSSGTALLLPPAKKDTEFTFRILSENGDDRIVWDRTDHKQVMEAKKTFNNYLNKGYKAYTVKQHGGGKGNRIDSFDDLLEEVVMQKGDEALLVPPTMPG